MYRIIRIPPEKGEEIRKKAVAGKFLDTARKIRKIKTDEGNFLEIPLTNSADEIVEDFQVIEQENPEFFDKSFILEEFLKNHNQRSGPERAKRWLAWLISEYRKYGLDS